jgi:hypothetical protein
MAAPLGNQFAAKAKEWEQSLKRAMARRADGDFRKTLDCIADRVIDQALEGDDKAWREIGDRIDGKVPQAIVGAADHPPVQITLASADVGL